MKNLKKLCWMLLALPVLVACTNVDDPDDFPNPNKNDGTKGKPYNVTEVLAGQKGNAVYVAGYIVGTIKTEGDGDAYKETIQMTAPFEGTTNILIAATDTEADRAKCVAVQLPAGAIRETLNLAKTAANYGKKVIVKGSLVAYFKAPGVKDTDPVDFVFEGYVPDIPTTGDVSICDDNATPKTTYAQIFDDAVKGQNYSNSEWKHFLVAGGRNFQGNDFSGNKYIQMTAHNAATTSRHQAWIVSPALDLNAAAKKEVSFDLAQGYTKADTKFEVYVLKCEGGETKKTLLTLPNPPAVNASQYSAFATNKIDLSAYSGKVYIGFYYDGAGGSSLSTTWQIDNFYFAADPATTVAFSSATSTKVALSAALNFEVKATANHTDKATTITQTGAPAWAILTDNGNGTATLAGTAPATAETSTITFTATNNGVTATQTFTLTVADPVAPTGNLILNPGFETWTGDVVANWTPKAGVDGFTVSKETTIFTEGAASIKLVHTGTKGTAGITPDRVRLEAGDYTWSFKYYTEAGKAAKLRIWGMSYDTADGSGQSAVPELVELKKTLQESTDLLLAADQWTTKSIDFTVPAGGAYFVFELRCYNGTDAIYLDDVKVATR